MSIGFHSRSSKMANSTHEARMFIHRTKKSSVLTIICVCIILILTSCSSQRAQVNFVFIPTNVNFTETYWRGVIKDFEAQNPDIQVNLYMYTWNNVQDKIKEMIAQGNPPTLARVATKWIPEYVAAGLLEPVDSYMSPEFRSQFIPLLIN